MVSESTYKRENITYPYKQSLLCLMLVYSMIIVIGTSLVTFSKVHTETVTGSSPVESIL